MKEEWKDIVITSNGKKYDYTGLYQVSNTGKIKSLERVDKHNHLVKEKIKKLCFDNYGYLLTTLSLNGKHKTYTVHKLVAKTFIPNPKNKPQINHINGNKTDNRIENLEWVTNSENQRHAYKIGLKKATTYWTGKFGNKHPNFKKVDQYDLQGNYIKTWYSLSDIERTLKIRHGNIYSCCKGKYKSAGGYIWKYKKED